MEAVPRPSSSEAGAPLLGPGLPPCNIVMKGGVTSGVVYPRAVVALAERFRFRRIGGTSAGAIAAAATAAAELGRRRDPDGAGGFGLLDGLPRALGEPCGPADRSKLFSLFQPTDEVRPVFEALVALGDRTPPYRKAWALLRAFPLAAVAGAVPGVVLAALLVGEASGPLLWWGLASALLLLVGGTALAVSAAAVGTVSRALPGQYYGLCTGYREGGEALTSWLDGLLTDLSGRAADAKPLTFGDLWGGPAPDGPDAVDLQMLTTCLTHGRPYRLPFDTNAFYFHSDEFRDLFPERVVAWMEARRRTSATAPSDPKLVPLPEPEDFPVVVAVRLSLSFPFLISAVPLYAVDYSRRAPREEREPERCWFSDGGICSNFPVHFFDQPLPEEPTFAINLTPFHPDYPKSEDESENVYVADSHLGGLAERWVRVPEGAGLRSLSAFAGSIKNAMQNWTDNVALRLPGYRDRIAHVALDAAEGGLNLDMPPELIGALGDRGAAAAVRLAERFDPEGSGDGLTWDAHRWVRYRSFVALLEGTVRSFHRVYSSVPARGRSYGDLVGREPGSPPTSYEWGSQFQAAYAERVTSDLLDLVEGWDEARRPTDPGGRPATLHDGAPRPSPELRVAPRV